ncbi:MAG: DNA-binding protein WhiA [Clostridia bacterium]|nr:putative sporulation transcription regulator WhiA [Clostridium sp. CAG:798]
MSFSLEVKQELSKINSLADKNNVKCELMGYLVTSNTSVQKNKVRFSTESQYNINRFSKLLNNLGFVNYDIKIQRNMYSIFINKNDIQELIRAEENINIANEILSYFLKSEILEKAFIRGTFLGSGTINNPEKKYHLEIFLKNLETAKYIIEILRKYSIDFKILERSKKYAIYTKEGEEISKFLALMGASASVLKFEEIRVYRDIKNNINRKVNCETANLNKIVNSSVKQINDIKYIKERGKFNELSEQLKEIAIVRIENPDMSLEELGKLLKKPIGKSGVNHRLRKIQKIVEELKEESNK